MIRAPVINSDFQVTSTNHKIECKGWKKPFKVIESNPQPTLFHMFLGHFQGWGLHYCPRQPDPVLENPFHENLFPSLQSKPPLEQLKAMNNIFEDRINTDLNPQRRLGNVMMILKLFSAPSTPIPQI